MAKTYKQIMDEARQSVPEVSPEQVKVRLDKGEHPVVLDVREKEEIRQGYVPGALALPRGFLEMRVEEALPDKNTPFNFGQPTRDDGKPIDPLKTPETFRVKCDVHTWMSAYVVGLDNPYYGVSGDDGTFSIPNLPPGEYTLTAWHESLGSKEIPVKVEAGKPAEVQIKFAAP